MEAEHGAEVTPSIQDCEYLSMRKLQNDGDIYFEPEDHFSNVMNNPVYQSLKSDNVHYASLRQSAQMEIFVDNFIKPKLYAQTISSSKMPNVTLTKELMKRVSKKRTSFNLIILGEPGLGKKTFIQCLTKEKIYLDEKDKSQTEIDDVFTSRNKIIEQPVILVKDGQKLYLNIIEVPGFGQSINNEKDLEDILSYVNEGFTDTFKFECSLDRSSPMDRNIHCCLYFISPYGHSIKPLDIEFFKQFQSKINIIPIIGKCDTFTKEELKKFKSNILKDFEKYGIDLFAYLNNAEPIEDEIDDIKEICEEIKNNIPFAISSSMNISKTKTGTMEHCREYPWGTVQTENTDISDFNRLETILTKSHINYFKKLTKTVYYENFRMKYILDRVK